MTREGSTRCHQRNSDSSRRPSATSIIYDNRKYKTQELVAIEEDARMGPGRQ